MVTSSSPGMPSGSGRAPVVTTMSAASNARPSTSTRPAPSRRALPCMVSAPVDRSQSSMRLATGSVKPRLRCMRAGQSIAGPPVSPRPSSMRALPTASAAASRTFFGSQPRRAQVPP